MDYSEIKKLMDDMGNSKLTEIEIEFPDGIKISMKKGLPSSKPVLKEDASITQKEVSEVLALKEKTEVPVLKEKSEFPTIQDEKVIKSPMVGTFYSRVTPNDEPYVSRGSKVKKGDIVCIIEAMKLMNEIESEIEGEEVEILCKDGDMVEYGQPLFKLK